MCRPWGEISVGSSMAAAVQKAFGKRSNFHDGIIQSVASLNHLDEAVR